MTSGVRVAVIGATGLVGRNIIACLEGRAFPLAEAGLYASSASEGKVLHVNGRPCRLTPLDRDRVREFDIAFFAAPPGVSREFAPLFAKAGAAAIDTSGDWALEPGTPLVVPEINPWEIRRLPGILSSPSDAAVLLASMLHPIRGVSRLRRVVATLCRPVSSGGRRALDEFDGAPHERPAGNPPPFDPAALIPPASSSGTDGERLAAETEKILGDSGIRMTAAFLRAPIRRGTFAGIAIETEDRTDVSRVRERLSKAPAVRLWESQGEPPGTPAEASGDIWVGGVREDPGSTNGLLLWASCDNLLKGSALNAVQIAEVLLRV